MCGRFTLRTPTETIADIFSHVSVPEIPANYNIAPTQSVAAIRNPPSNDEGGPQFAWLRWGLLPAWAKDHKLAARMINARSETIREKPAFRSAFARRRCLILADGFYEWVATRDGKQPMYISMLDEGPFCMAGLWEANHQVNPETVESCTIITTSANALVAPIHDRMPVILPADRHEMWLDQDFRDLDALQRQLQPLDAEQMQARPVSRQVNKVGFNTPQCIERVVLQQDLF